MDLSCRGQGKALISLPTSDMEKGCRFLGIFCSWHFFPQISIRCENWPFEVYRMPPGKISLAGKDIGEHCSAKFGGRNIDKKKTFPFILFSLSFISSFSFTYIYNTLPTLHGCLFFWSPMTFYSYLYHSNYLCILIYLFMYICLCWRLPTFQDLWAHSICLNV